MARVARGSARADGWHTVRNWGPAGLEAKPKAKQAAAKKRVFNAELSSQMAAMSKLFPQLADQLNAMRRRQETMEKQLASPAQAHPPGANLKAPHLQQQRDPARGG